MTKEQLEQQIQKANNAYWNNNTPTISDIEYDKLVEQLKTLDPTNSLLNHIGGLKGKYKHKEPMLSLDKAYTKQEVIAWMKKYARSENELITIEPKSDGLAVIRLSDTEMYTRGDGIYGESITVNPYICHFGEPIPVDTDKQVFGVDSHFYPIVGELLITHENFQKYCESGILKKVDGTLYKNSRNAIAGLIGQKDTRALPKGIATIIPYETYGTIFPASMLETLFDNYITGIINEVGSKYPIDGVVFKLTDVQYSKTLGSTSHHPRGAIAFKFANVSDTSVVKSIEWQQGMEYLTPVLSLADSININGYNITKATCHNAAFILSHNLIVGDTVRVERAGDVIPKVVEVINTDPSISVTLPTVCPICGEATTYNTPELECTYTYCPGKLLAKLTHAAKLLHIDGIGPAIGKLLIDKLQIQHIYQLLETNYCYDVGHLPGFTAYSADQLYRNITQVVGAVYEHEVLAACCIPGIGKSIARTLLETYSYTELIEMAHTRRTELPSLLQSVIGEQRGLAVSDLLCDEDGCMFIMKMYHYFKPLPTVAVTNTGHRLVCFTGKMELSRDECKTLATSKGDVFTDKMTKNVSLVVRANNSINSSKVKYANKHNIPVVIYDEYK